MFRDWTTLATVHHELSHECARMICPATVGCVWTCPGQRDTSTPVVSCGDSDGSGGTGPPQPVPPDLVLGARQAFDSGSLRTAHGVVMDRAPSRDQAGRETWMPSGSTYQLPLWSGLACQPGQPERRGIAPPGQMTAFSRLAFAAIIRWRLGPHEPNEEILDLGQFARLLLKLGTDAR